jgi:methylmalonyl-CoA mutase
MSDLKKRSYPHGDVAEPLYTSGPENNVGYRIQPWWTMVQEHLVEKEFIANTWALNRLQHGASGLLFYLTEEHYLPRILKDIQLEHISLGLVVEGNGPAVMETLLHHAHNEIIPVQKLRGFINIDPIEIAARTGIWHEKKMYELGELSRLTPTGMKYMCCNANFYGSCGASPATQLGLAVAHLDFYISNFGEVGLSQYWVALTSGTYIFEEIAKHRALRVLWRELLEAYDFPFVHLEIYSETSTTHQSRFDAHSNLLRATSAAFGAITGGADALQIRPYNSALKGFDEEGERLALNQHFMMAYESGMDRVMDPSKGSYFIENKTAAFVKEARLIWKEITQLGGILEALRSGWIQDRIDSEVKTAMPEKVLGVNFYPNDAEKLHEGITVAPPVSRAEHKERFMDRDIEPLRVVRWSEPLEFQRYSSTV